MRKSIINCMLIAACVITPGLLRAQVDIIPKPQSVEVQQGTFALSAATPILVAQPELKSTAELFSGLIQPVVGNKMKVSKATAIDGAVNIAINKALSDEEYTLHVTPQRITIECGSARSALYALQSLRQMLPAKQVATADVQAAMIKDKPCFAYRGMMLDVSRHMFSVDQVKQFIDILSLHKINTFHWHLTEDQGWRIEIKKYPELTKIGSMRKETLIGRYKVTPHIYDGTPYGGFFTQKQVKDIVRYATERHIEVIPEIEMPGHGLGALSTYSWLGCTGGPYEVWTRWGISKDVYCAGKESTFEFIENVLSEVIELFPSKYIHIGGDECPKDRWKECPLCQARIKENNLKDEKELQSYFIKRIEKWLNAKGRNIIGWDEIIEGGLSKTATVMSWRGAKGGIMAAKSGNYTIMSPNSHCYFDYYQTEQREQLEPPCGGRKSLPIERVYSLDPYDQLNANERKYVLGVQANLWSEYVTSVGLLQHMILPRMAALSEVGWSYDRKDYESFRTRMNNLVGIYKLAGYKYAPYMFQ